MSVAKEPETDAADILNPILDAMNLVADLGDLARIIGHLVEVRDIELVSASEWARLARDLRDGLSEISERLDAARTAASADKAATACVKGAATRCDCAVG